MWGHAMAQVLDVPCSAAADPQGWRALMQYDRLCFPDTRERFLAQFFLRNPSVQVRPQLHC